MGKGKSQTVKTSSSPPPQFMNAYTDLMNAGTALASQPLQQYGGPMVQGFTPQQQQAFSTIQNSQGMAAPFLNSAAQYASAGATPISPTAFSADQVGQYLSPYTQNVVDATQRQFNLQNAQAQTGLKGNLAAAGALGGDRQAVMQAQLAGQQQNAQAPVIAGLYNQGYGQALNEFNQQQGVGLQAQEATNQGAQNAAYAYGMLGPAALNTSLTGAAANLQAGNMQQQLGQEQLNIPYEQFIQQQAWPYQQLGFLGGLDTSLGSVAGGTSSTTQPGPNIFSQLLGAGLGAASLFGGGKDGGRMRGLADGGESGADPYIERMEMAGLSQDANFNPASLHGENDAVMDPSRGYIPGLSGMAHGMGPPAPPAAMGQQQSGISGDLLGAAAPGIRDMFGGSGNRGTYMGGGGPGSAIESVYVTPQVGDSGGFLSGIGSWLGFGGGGHVPHFDSGGQVSYLPGTHGIPIPQISQSVFAQPAAGMSPDANSFNPLPQYHPASTASNPALPSTSTDLPPDVLAALKNINPASIGQHIGGGGFLSGLFGGMFPFAHGGVTHLADGGDSDPLLPNSPMPDADHTAPQGSQGLATRVLSSDEMPDGWAGQATHTGQGFDYVPPKPDWRNALLTAGLSMMAGTSPNAGVNIGRGAMAGMESYQKQIDLDAHPIIDHSGKTIRIYYPSERKWIDTGMPTDTWTYHQDMIDERRSRDTTAAQDRADRLNLQDREFKEREADRAAALAQSRQVHEDNLREGHYEWSPGTQIDPTSGQPVQGMWRLPTRGGEQPTFMPNASMTGKQPPRQAGMTDNEALDHAWKDYNFYVEQDKANGGQGTVYNADGSKADPRTWVTGRAAQLARGAGNAAVPQRAAPTNTLGPASPPPLPSGVPAGSSYSPSRHMWRDGTGKLYNEQGAPI